jgi:hypothetical protein
MHNIRYKRYLTAIVLFVIATVAGLWSWNTLSELFNLPQAQYRHVLAASFLLLLLRRVLSPGQRTIDRGFGSRHEHPGR